MNMVDSALETLGDELQNTCITKILVALMGDSGGQKVPPIPKFLRSRFEGKKMKSAICNSGSFEEKS